MNNNKLKTEDYFVAYLDILGIKEKIKKDYKDKYIENLDYIYNKALEDKRYAIKILEKYIFVKIFSDNILIAIKCTENSDRNKEIIEKLINLCGLIQVHSLKYCYLVRGAIVKGKFYKKDLFISGQALVTAVNIEEEIAIYPRIIIDNSLLDFINIKENYIKKDIDSLLYVNIFYYFNDNCYKNFKKHILEELKKEKNNKKIVQKLMWFINNYNEYFKQKQKEDFAKNTQIITEEEIQNIINKAEG